MNRIGEVAQKIHKNIHEPMAILIIVEDSLTVYPPHHHMIDILALLGMV